MLKQAKQIKAVLFDCDGLLVDSETLGMRIAAKVCEEFGLALTQEELTRFIGVTDEKWYRETLDAHQSSLDVHTLLNRQFELYEAELGTVPTFAGASELPHRLKENGYKIGLVSGSTRAQIDIILDALGLKGAFNSIVTCEDTRERSKPDPYGYQLGLTELNKQRGPNEQIGPDETVVLEDASTGIQAGLKAGMKVIGVKNAGMQDISAATRTVDSLLELLASLPDEWLQDSNRV